MADRTTFAGLTHLDPSDPLSADGFGLQDRNPRLMDYFIRLLFSAKHDAHLALADPSGDPVAAITAGGHIPADLGLSVGYTLLDADGGETTLSPIVTVETAASLQPPDDGPAVTPDTVSGTLLAGTYSYAVTFTDGQGGETELGPPAVVTIPSGAAANKVTVTGLDTLITGAGAAGWRLYRSINGEEFHLIASGAGPQVVDDGSLQVDCIAPPSSTGTTNATSRLTVTVPGGQPAEAVQFRVYVGVDGDFGAQSLLGTYDVTQFGVAQVYDTLAFLPGSPPETSTAMPGLPQITSAELESGAGGGGSAVLRQLVSDNTDHAIGDSSAPDLDILFEVTDPGLRQRVEVGLWLEHTDLPNLTVELISPDMLSFVVIAPGTAVLDNIGISAAACDLAMFNDDGAGAIGFMGGYPLSQETDPTKHVGFWLPGDRMSSTIIGDDDGFVAQGTWRLRFRTSNASLGTGVVHFASVNFEPHRLPTRGHYVDDEGVAKPLRPVLDFQGVDVTVTDDPVGFKTIVTIAPQAGTMLWSGDYDVATTYATGAVVKSGGVIYVSLQDANTGNDPATSGAFWQAI